MLKTQTKWSVRHIAPDDYPFAVSLLRNNFPLRKWTNQVVEDLRICGPNLTNLVLVAEDKCGALTGLLHAALSSKAVLLNRLAVADNYRRQGVGTALLQGLMDTHSFYSRDKLIAHVPELNLPAQLFFKAQGFKAKVSKRPFGQDNNREPTYRFQLDL